MSIEGGRRGGCLDGLVTWASRGRYGVETIVVYPDSPKPSQSKDKKPILTIETYFGEGIPALPTLQRRIVKTPKVL